jgi:Ca2+-binding RTX toxin-like protein
MAPVGLGTLEGGGGNDVLRGGLVNGNMSGGSGDDTLILGRFNPGPFDAPPPTVDGGIGFDTLNITARPSFDITGNDGQNLGGIEKIDMTGGAPVGQQLVLSMASLLGLSNTSDTLFVTGDASDHVSAQGTWLASSAQTIDGLVYNSWISGGATLLVQNDISVTFV